MFTTKRNTFLRLFTGLKRLSTLGNIGITPRLAIAFAIVAILAATSNLIVENSVSLVERVTETDVPAPVAVATVAPVQTAPIPAPALAPAHDAARIRSAQLALALGNFDTAAREHVDLQSTASAAQYTGARTELGRLARAYVNQDAHTQGNAPRALQSAIQAYAKNGDALVKAAQDRRALLASYSTIYSSMNTRLQESIDSGWKIMGRVIARQSLLKLSTQLDEIQNRFATREAPEVAGGGLNRLIDAEHAFAATLEKHQAALRRSHGAEWYLGVSSDFTALTTTRVALTEAEERKARITQSFSRDASRLLETLSRSRDAEARAIATTPQQLPNVADAVAATPIARFPEVSIPAASPQSSRRSLVAWVSAVVLAVLAYICVSTILSVVRPVRRLLEATTRLSQGGPAPQLAPGGIHELDTLTQAFNTMAGQLAAAQLASREAQHGLETKVEERTRQLKELAERDPLTGLANRRQLFTALNASIERAAANSERVGAYFLDIDNFKTLNDSMGHAYGDRVLVAIARRLEACAESFGFAARLGGDEFMIVREGAATIDEIVASGSEIVGAFHDPIEIDGRELIVSVSVGASVYPDHEQDAPALLRAADAALFNAKAMGRSRLTVFTPELLVTASAKFAIEQRLRRAIEKGEFELFYQPEVCVQELEVTLVEALLRWRMPDGTYQSPGHFLAVAEESGLIAEINDWVLRTAMQTAAQWHHGPWPAARVAINVSPRQFLDYRFAAKLQSLLEEFKLPARCIELELTESVLQTGPTTIKALTQLRSMGVAIALDDFGTGFSSMASLEQLPITRIKLDRSLIARMDSNPRSASIARATIGLCGELGLAVTAEGVERLEQFTALLGYRGMTVQGYLLGRPVARGDLLEQLKQISPHCHELVLRSRALPSPALAAQGAGGEARERKASGLHSV